MKKQNKKAPTFHSLYKKILKFNEARDWKVEASDLAKSVVIEAAELLEHFQWDASDMLEAKRYKRNLKNKNLKEIGFEVADVFWYLLSLCDKVGIDPLKAISDKYDHNEKKYPVEMFKGRDHEKLYYKRKAEYRRRKH